MGLGLLAVGLGVGWLATLGSGLFAGGLAGTAFGLGAAFRRRSRRDARLQRAPTSRQRAVVAATGLVVLVAVLVLDPFRPRLAAEEGEALPSKPILAVLPYEGEPDAERATRQGYAPACRLRATGGSGALEAGRGVERAVDGRGGA